ncbi:hypothetical protein AN643_03305 [Candidatus Epulonipiscioides saccharophilum]|nr:hypothetical protein AN643_03305 [Epulopiscium sp. SCG-B10WGA-EpuloB]
MNLKTILFFILFILFNSTNIFALNVFHSITKNQIVTHGLLHTQTSLVTDIGWLDINILAVDLSNFNIKLAPIDAGVFDTKQTISQMAKNNGAVAAVNADFFSLTSTVPSFGICIEDENIKQIYTTDLANVGPQMDMASILIDRDLNIIMEYIDTNVLIKSESGQQVTANAYNKIGTYFHFPVVLDNQYTQTTDEIINKFPRASTILIKENRVISHMYSGSAQIPNNGYAIVMDNSLSEKMFSQFPIGSNIKIDISIHLHSNNQPNLISNHLPNINQVKFGIGGGGLILKDGLEYLGSSNIVDKNNRHPRTLIATTDKFGELLLITIDGRIYSAGATHREVIDILKNLGAKNAMYLDGGGSTTMVVRNQGDFFNTVQNVPSDGIERKVMNGIGIFSTNKPDKLADIHLELDRTVSVVGEPIKYKITGIDRSFNPIKLDDANIEIVGIQAEIQENMIIPKTTGNAFFVVEKDGISTETKINIIPKLIQSKLDPTTLNLISRETNILEHFEAANYHSLDPLYIDNLTYPPQTGEYYVNIIGPTKINKFIPAGDIKDTLNFNLNQYDAKVILASKNNIALDIHNLFELQSNFSAQDYKDVTLIYLNSDQAGLINTDVHNWKKLKDTINFSSKRHIIILTSHNPLTGFENKREGEALHNYLASIPKNIFVVTTNLEQNSVQIIDNVRYINTTGLNTDHIFDLTKSSFLQFKIEGSKINYTFRNISYT